MKIKLVIIITLLCGSSSAIAAQLLSQQLKSCAVITNDKKRLSCFDRLTKATTNTTDNKDIFGFESKKVNHLSPEQVAVQVVNVRTDARDKKIFTLASGQVWQQKESGTYNLKANKAVFIKKGALGSFFLGQLERNRKIRVKRIK